MTLDERKKSVVRVLILLEPKNAHEERCPARKNPEKCNCYLIRNTLLRADTLSDAGLLCSLDEVKK